MSDVNVHIRPHEDETETLVCNWCGIEHPASTGYKQEVLARGEQRIAEIQADFENPLGLTPEETWTCACCFLHIKGFPAEIAEMMNTGCDHPVPTERVPIRDHSDHGRGDDDGPMSEDCPCRGTVIFQKECADAGCGFCQAAEQRENE